MISDIKPILKKLEITELGHFDENAYVIQLQDSNDYARMYSLLEQNAINTEYPNFGTNTNKTTVKITNYFEVEEDNVTYNLFLVADFDNDKYYLRIVEK